jgi:RHS repeat-associated protein
MLDLDENPVTPDVKQVKSDFANPFGYQGMWRDEHTGLYHTHYRLYDPQHVRWLTVDPAGYRDGQNLYRFYAGPNGVDVLGLDGYFFDGTGNHPFDKNYDDSENFSTNVWKMHSYYKGKKVYVPGIGSGYSPALKKYEPYYNGGKDVTPSTIQQEGVTGDTMKERVDYMLEKFEENLDNKANADRFNIDVFGFSRGSATAVIFLQKIQEKINSGEARYKDVKIRFAGLYDTVSSMRFINEAWYKFELPKEMQNKVPIVSFLALDEQRSQFQCEIMNSAINIGFRGVHSDVGGGYFNNSFDLVSRIEMCNIAKQFSVPLYESKIEGDIKALKSIDWSSKVSINSKWYYNDNENRKFPQNMILHPTVLGYMFSTDIKNPLKGRYPVKFGFEFNGKWVNFNTFQK